MVAATVDMPRLLRVAAAERRRVASWSIILCLLCLGYWHCVTSCLLALDGAWSGARRGKENRGG